MQSHPGQTQPPLCSPIHTEAARLDTQAAVLGARAVGSREADPGRRGHGQESGDSMSRVRLPLPQAPLCSYKPRLPLYSSVPNTGHQPSTACWGPSTRWYSESLRDHFLLGSGSRSPSREEETDLERGK